MPIKTNRYICTRYYNTFIIELLCPGQRIPSHKDKVFEVPKHIGCLHCL
jgi:hypothetical protein